MSEQRSRSTSDSRRYIIIAVHERTGRVTALPMNPEAHHEAAVMLKRFSPHPLRRLQLHDASQLAPEFLPRTVSL